MTTASIATRAERVAEAQRLRAKGLLLREISERMGARPSTVSQWLSDPDLSTQRARRSSYAQPCADCGAPTDGSGGHAAPRTRCAECARRHRHETRYWTPEAIIGAIQCWADEHGGIPPSASEWLKPVAALGYPPVAIVRREFGTWNAAIVAAGYSPNAVGRYGRDGEDMELCQEIRERYEAGESPPALADEYGCTRPTIVYRVRKAGGRIRGRSEAQQLRHRREDGRLI